MGAYSGQLLSPLDTMLVMLDAPWSFDMTSCFKLIFNIFCPTLNLLFLQEARKSLDHDLGTTVVFIASSLIIIARSFEWERIPKSF